MFPPFQGRDQAPLFRGSRKGALPTRRLRDRLTKLSWRSCRSWQAGLEGDLGFRPFATGPRPTALPSRHGGGRAQLRRPAGSQDREESGDAS